MTVRSPSRAFRGQRKKIASIISVVSTLMCIGHSAQAETEESKPSEEIVVVGMREAGYTSKSQTAGTFGEMSIFETPFSVLVISQEVLVDQQVRALGDLVRNDPSTIVSTPPGFNDTINVRGYNLDNSSSYRREGLIFQNQAQSPFENKAAVEIVKGPTSVRYGFTQPGGVVNYVLKRPTDELYRNFSCSPMTMEPKVCTWTWVANSMMSWGFEPTLC